MYSQNQQTEIRSGFTFTPGNFGTFDNLPNEVIYVALKPQNVPSSATVICTMTIVSLLLFSGGCQMDLWPVVMHPDSSAAPAGPLASGPIPQDHTLGGWEGDPQVPAGV